MYKEVEEFVAVFRAAHPYLVEQDRAALVELTALWAGRNIEAGCVTAKNPQGFRTGTEKRRS